MDYKPFDIKQIISGFIRPKTIQQAISGLSVMSALFVIPFFFIQQGIQQSSIGPLVQFSLIVSPLGFLYYAICYIIITKRPIVLPSQSYVFFDSRATSSGERYADFAQQNGFRYLPGSESIDLSDLANCSVITSPANRKHSVWFRIDGTYRGYPFSLTSMNVWTYAGKGFEIIGVLRLGIVAGLAQTNNRAAFETEVSAIGIARTVEYDNQSVYMIVPGGISSKRDEMLQLFEHFDIAIKCASDSLEESETK
jgi:hypothetical protein